MAAKYELDLDLKPSGIPQKIHLNQYDKGQTITVNLYNDDEIYTPVGKVWVSGTKKDNKGFQYQCQQDGSKVIITVTDQMTVYHGDTEVEVSDVKDGMVQGSANFILSVEEAAFHDDTIISDTDIPAVQRVAEDIDKVETWKNETEAAAQNAKTSETNAKASEDNAKQSETNAKTSETNASASATLSESYAKGGTGTRDGEDTDNALYYKDLAETAKTEAEGVKTDTESLKTDVEKLKSDASEIKSDTEKLKTDASKSAVLAQSYAVGGTKTRDGEDADNAKAYAAQAKSAAEAASSGMKAATATTIGAVKPDNDTITVDPDGTIHGNTKITVDDTLSETSKNPVENRAVFQKFAETDKSIKDVNDSIAKTQNDVSELTELFNEFLQDGTITVPLVNENGDYLGTENGDILVATKKIGG